MNPVRKKRLFIVLAILAGVGIAVALALSALQQNINLLNYKAASAQLVAIGFATVLNGQPEWEPPIKDGVLVYPGSTFNRDYTIGKGMRAGQATVNSPLIITQQSLDDSFRYLTCYLTEIPVRSGVASCWSICEILVAAPSHR